MNLVEKLEQIHSIIKEVGAENPTTGNILLEGFGLSLNLIKSVAENGPRETIDVSEHLEIISRVLGYDLEKIVQMAFESSQLGEVTKQADAETLDFITSGMDDYEKFLAQNKAKDDLDFLKKSI